MPIVAQCKSTIIHNALSNIRLGSGIAPVLKYVASGVNVGFGCDGAASNDGQDLLEAVKIGSFLHNITDNDYRNWLTPQKSLTMATKDAFQGVGLNHVVGEIKVGQHADLVLFDLKNLSLLPRTDPVAYVFFFFFFGMFIYGSYYKIEWYYGVEELRLLLKVFGLLVDKLLKMERLPPLIWKILRKNYLKIVTGQHSQDNPSLFHNWKINIEKL